MEDWLPHLYQLLGDDDEGRAQARLLLTLSQALGDDRLQVRDRVRLLDGLSRLDSVQQIFLLPWLLELTSDPSRVVRQRLLLLLDELLGNTQTSLLALLGRLANRGTAQKALTELLVRLRELLCEEEVDLEAPFTALLFLRTPAFGVAALLGLDRWARRHPLAKDLRDDISAFFSEEEQTPFRDRLREWLSSGPVFLRYLLVRWLGRSGVPLDPEAEPARLLYHRYLEDPDPLVAGVAIESFARQIGPQSVHAAVDFIMKEYSTFLERRLEWQGPLAGEAVQTLSLSQMRALGFLAKKYYPDAEALAALRRILTAWPKTSLDLGDSHLSDNQRRKVFCASQLLWGPRLRVRLKPARSDGMLVGLAGFRPALALDDPGEVLKKDPDCETVWAAASLRGPVPGDPLHWRYEILESVPPGRSSGDRHLLGLTSPALSSFLKDEKRPTEFRLSLRRRLEQEIDRRGWWMLEACDLVAGVVEVGLDRGDTLGGAPLHDLFSYLADLAIAANLCRRGPDNGPRVLLKARTRSIFLNRFARREVFEFLFPHRQAEPLEAQLLTALAGAALRALPEEPANAWIARNHGVLRSISLRDDWHEKLRGAALVALQFHPPRYAKTDEDGDDPGLRQIERRLSHLPGRGVYHHYTQALAFITDEDLDALRHDELRMNHLELVADRRELAKPDRSRAVQLWSEVLARSLERDEPGSDDARRGAGVCLGALVAGNEFQTAFRLRLLHAFGTCSIPLEAGNPRRLLDHLLRTASSSELQLYLYMTHDRNQQDSELWRWLVTLLVREDEGVVLGGARQFDLHGIADRLARRRVILRFLSERLRDQPELYEVIRRLRWEEPLPRETMHVVPAGGEVLPVEGRQDPSPELWSILRPLADPDRAAVAEMGGDLLPAFVNHPQARAPLRCLVQLHPASPGLLDFHALPGSVEQKRAILAQRLDIAPHVRVLARVESVEGGGKYRVDLGVGMPKVLRQSQIVSFDRPLRPDDTAVVEVRRETGKKRVVSEVKLRPWLGGEEGIRVEDLRNDAGALETLETLWRGGGDFKLRATVKKLVPLESGDVLCLLEIGFLWHSADGPKLPAIFLEEDLPEVGAEVLVDRPAFLRLEDKEVADAGPLRLEAVSENTVPEGWIVAGTLHSRLLPHSGRRRWCGRIGHLELPVDRRKLSGDLNKLFTLDAADDSELRRFETEPILFKVVEQKLSVVDAPPTWRGFDLVLAVQAGRVGRMTFLERPDSRQMLFEVDGLERPGTLGVLALVEEGELFDEAGEPIGDRLRPGETISLQVTHGRLSAEGRLQASSGDGPEPWDVPHLQLADEIDDSALRFRDAYPRESLVQVRLKGSGEDLELLDPEPGFPPPLVVADPRERDGFRGVPGVVDALVTGDWQAESEDYTLTVGRVRERYLHLHPRAESRRRDYFRYLRLDVGTVLRSRKHFVAEAEGIACYVGGLKVALDPQMTFLVPEPPTAEKLNRARLSAPLRVTAMSSRHLQLRKPAGMTPIPYLEQHLLALGLVVSTPMPDSGSKQVGVLWTASPAEERPGRYEISERWAFEPPTALFNGDILRAAVTAEGEIELVRVHRYLTGTILHQAVPCASWASSLAGSKTRGLVATLLRRPESLDETWLFAFAPAHLVEVEPEQLHLAHLLDRAWSLDRVRFDLRWEPAGGVRLRLEVREVHDGPLRAAVGEQLILEVQRLNWRTGGFSCVLRGQGKTQKLGGLLLELGPNELPPHESPKALARQLRGGGRQAVPVTCTLAGYRLEVRQELDEDDPQPRIAYEFDLRAHFDTYTPRQVQPESRPQKRPLAEALAATGRLDAAAGRIVEVEEGLAVRLDSYRHPDPLPLPAAEITWIPHAGDLVSPGKDVFTVFLDDTGRPVASLRRKPPLVLGDWLRKMGLADTREIITDHRLLYFDELTEEHYRECGLPELEDEEGAAPDPLVLFESAPGATVVARTSELRFLSRPFDPKTLRTGDAVLSFQLLAPSVSGGDEELSGHALNVLRVEIDIARQVQDFAEHKGLHFGRVGLVDGVAVLDELRGADYRSHAVGRRRLARWKLCLEAPDATQMKWLAELGKDDYVYLQLVKVDREAGELVFRLAPADQVFQEQNLVFVRARRIEPYGDSRKLSVEPLTQGYPGEYMVPDNLFSERRGRLEGSRRAIGGIFMARVYRQEVDREKPFVKLSLIHTPRRRFGYLMSEQRWQAIVKQVEPHYLVVELGEGVNAEIPRNRILGVKEIWQELQPGDVLMLRRLSEQYRVELVDRIRSHLAYLELEAQRTVLTELWASPKMRQKQFERDGVLNCNLIGLSQLRGISKLSEESVGTDRILPQVVRGYHRGWIRLEEGVGKNAFVGRLRFAEDGSPEMVDEGGKSVTLRWDELTCREGDPATKRAWVTRQRWRNTALSDKLSSIAEADVVAHRFGNRASFTRLARHPFPVDHLVEQFSPAKSGLRTRAESRCFVVARAEPERLILELAPGRYAELPVSLIRPLHDGRLEPGLALDWSRLARGDRLLLERCAAEASSEELLPQFRVRELEPGHGRHLAGSLWTVLRRRTDGRVVLGAEGGPELPADHLEVLLHDHVADLRGLPEKDRYRKLRDLCERFGSRLLLASRVAGFLDDSQGGLYFLEIGVAVPVPGRDHWGDPAARAAAETPLTQGTELWIRVLEAEFSGPTLQHFTCRIETELDEERTSCLVRTVGGRLRRCHAPPAGGDTVMVYRPFGAAADECRVAGLEEYSSTWDAHADDPLHLHLPAERQLAFARLLDRPGAFLWATLESIDPGQQRLRLSRHAQLAGVALAPGRLSRARVTATLTGRCLLADLQGVPTILPVGELCRGIQGQLDLGPCLEKGPLEVEVFDAGEDLSARAYRPPTGDFDATVEFVLPAGVVARSNGCRFFVERRELAWCSLEDGVFERLFPSGFTLRLVRVTQTGRPEVFSHIRTFDIRSEVAELVRSNAPVYVAREHVDGRRAIVRGRSGVLMELRLDDETEVPERLCAYLDHIDESERRIVLSQQPREARIWDLPSLPETYAVDRMTTRVIEAGLERLRQVLSASGAEGIGSWARQQERMEPSPRNLRLILEQIREDLGESAVWQRPADLESEAACDFHAVWRELNAVLCGDVSAASITGPTRFALGYHLLQRGDYETAADQLDQAAADEALRQDFDVLLTRARAHFQMGRTDEATLFLKELTDSLWASALHTLTVPLFEPEIADPFSDLPGRWNLDLEAGRLEFLEQRLPYLAAGEVLSLRAQAQEIWFALARGRLDGLDHLTEGYLDGLSLHAREAVDPRHFGLAAYLSFARGKVVEGWGFLESMVSTPAVDFAAELESARFWRAWLNGDDPEGARFGPTEPLLSALIPVLRQCRWRRICEGEAFDRLWREFRGSRRHWVLSAPRCRALPEPPKDVEQLDQWAIDQGVASALPYLREDSRRERDA